MVRAVHPDRHTEFVCRSDRDLPEGEQTVFFVRPFTVLERRKVIDAIDSAGTKGAKVSIGQLPDEVFRAGVAGWRNLLDADDVEIEPEMGGKCPFTTREVITDAAMERVPATVRQEIAEHLMETEIAKSAGLSEADRGN